MPRSHEWGFIAKVQADTSLQEQLKAEGADPVAIAKAAGFSITTEDLNTNRQNLSEDEPEGMAGGLACDYTAYDTSVPDSYCCSKAGSLNNCCVSTHDC